MNKEDIKKTKAKLNARYGIMSSYERVGIAEEHLAEEITKEVDSCPIDEIKDLMLMHALDTALDNLEINKTEFIEAWSKPDASKDHKIVVTKDGDDIKVEYFNHDFDMLVAAASDIIDEITKHGITTVTALAAGLSVVLEKKYDKNTIGLAITLMHRGYMIREDL